MHPAPLIGRSSVLAAGIGGAPSSVARRRQHVNQDIRRAQRREERAAVTNDRTRRHVDMRRVILDSIEIDRERFESTGNPSLMWWQPDLAPLPCDVRPERKR